MHISNITIFSKTDSMDTCTKSLASQLREILIHSFTPALFGVVMVVGEHQGTSGHGSQINSCDDLQQHQRPLPAGTE
eukprot:c6019_g1_i1 orf=277-507(+)